MKNYLLAIVSYIGPGDRSGSRVKVTFPRFKKSRYFPFDQGARGMADQIEKELSSRGIVVIGKAEASGNREAIIVEFPDTFTGSPLSQFLRII